MANKSWELTDGWTARWYQDEEPGARFVVVMDETGQRTESDVEATSLAEAREGAQTMMDAILDARRMDAILPREEQ